ncbi:protein GVQW3-like [Toxorhynchites rutilus septentrionalis]|uniref:protein GVQW3-like n=1 Tax=Toxorhynchites rutilus septentrionalis TaxID=329112 RepID=UPI00247A27AF|nr:protein GVQW3-like [Toxorhynchites rutilus septentrionalis]
MEQRDAIKFRFKLKKTPSETLELLQIAYGNEFLSRSKVFEWYARFKAGRELLADDPRDGRPSTSATDANIERVRVGVASNPRATVEMLADEFNISEGSVHTILTKKLVKSKICAKFVPNAPEQKIRRVEASETPTEMADSDPYSLDKIITGLRIMVFSVRSFNQTTVNGMEGSHRGEADQNSRGEIENQDHVMAFFDSQALSIENLCLQGKQ